MYGVHNGVNFPGKYGYGKDNRAQQGPNNEKHDNAAEKTSGRTDQILFSAVTRRDKDSVSSLSDGAKKLLAELKGKYKNYDFMIADYETDQEASDILSTGKGEYNVLITPDLLEKMAADEGERAKYEGIISGAAEQFDEMEKNLTENGKSILQSLGFTVKGDGTVDFYAKLIGGVTTEDGDGVAKSSLINELTNMVNTLAENRAKMIEQAREERKENNKPVDKEEQKRKSTLPPKSFEKYKKEPKPYSTEKDYGNLPPESFEKYREKEEGYPAEEDYGTLPPESFKKYQSEADTDMGDKGDTMNFSV